MAFLLICMYVTVPIFEYFFNNSVKQFPYKMSFPYDPYNGYKYIFTYFVTSVSGFAVVFTLFAEDSFLCYFITYSCGQLKIIQRNIENIMETGHKNVIRRSLYNPSLFDYRREYQRELTSIIGHHNVLIRLVWRVRYDVQTLNCIIRLFTDFAVKLNLCLVRYCYWIS